MMAGLDRPQGPAWEGESCWIVVTFVLWGWVVGGSYFPSNGYPFSLPGVRGRAKITLQGIDQQPARDSAGRGYRKRLKHQGLRLGHPIRRHPTSQPFLSPLPTGPLDLESCVRTIRRIQLLDSNVFLGNVMTESPYPDTKRQTRLTAE
jgi:hypothetical protein